MCPGCDIAMAMLENAPNQPAPHSLTALAEEAARTRLLRAAGLTSLKTSRRSILRAAMSIRNASRAPIAA